MEGLGAEGMVGKIGKTSMCCRDRDNTPKGVHHLPAKVSELGNVES